MKPAPFDYAKPNSVEGVFDLLDRYRDEARLLAGGQSLIPSLNMRLSAPAILIDITGLDALRGIVVGDGVLRIGALTTYSQLKASAEVARAAPMRGFGELNCLSTLDVAVRQRVFVGKRQFA